MCLSVAVHNPDKVLAKGEHMGFEWNVVQNGRGYRCGYVRVPKGHPWHGKSYHNEAFVPDVHGGVTFAAPGEPCDELGEDDGWWIGFDCSHRGDESDPELSGSEISDYPRLRSSGTVRTQEYVEGECRSLCKQASQAERSSR